VADPEPALADGIEDGLRAGTVEDCGRRRVDHQQPLVGVDHDMALATDRLLVRVVAALRPRRQSLDGLAAGHAGAGVGLVA